MSRGQRSGTFIEKARAPGASWPPRPRVVVCVRRASLGRSAPSSRGVHHLSWRARQAYRHRGAQRSPPSARPSHRGSRHLTVVTLWSTALPRSPSSPWARIVVVRSGRPPDELTQIHLPSTSAMFLQPLYRREDRRNIRFLSVFGSFRRSQWGQWARRHEWTAWEDCPQVESEERSEPSPLNEVTKATILATHWTSRRLTSSKATIHMACSHRGRRSGGPDQ